MTATIKQAEQRTHYLADPISGEGEMSFAVLGNGMVEVAERAHPDLPFDVSTVSRDEARRIYRAAIKAGWLAA